ncbi:hypothetical protein ACH5RR_026371 [Cinchona calisaya]|uniref:Uncharacterized protein n=1 Tax=Cinchona calisaya TaxID=153742 RepID=A0ABD2Z4I8_9GENT
MREHRYKHNSLSFGLNNLSRSKCTQSQVDHRRHLRSLRTTASQSGNLHNMLGETYNNSPQTNSQIEHAQLQVYRHVISRTVISQEGQMETSTIISLNSFPTPMTNELPFCGLGSQIGQVQISTNSIQRPYFSITGQQSLTEAQIQHETDFNVNFDWNLEIRPRNIEHFIYTTFSVSTQYIKYGRG